MDAPPGSLTLSKGSGAQSAPAGWTAHHGVPDTPSPGLGFQAPPGEREGPDVL